MNNYEKITAIDFLKKRKEIFDSLGGKGKGCEGVWCCECPLNNSNNGFNLKCIEFETSYPLEAIKTVMDYKITIDWSKVAVDTPLLVRDSGGSVWHKRYFAKYEDGDIYTFKDGKTSWSANTDDKADLTSWKYTKLAEKED